jgi:hypothetical protein
MLKHSNRCQSIVIIAHVDDNIVLDVLNGWFALRIKKRRVKEAME